MVELEISRGREFVQDKVEGEELMVCPFAVEEDVGERVSDEGGRDGGGEGT